jgi:hypothetical protein
MPIPNAPERKSSSSRLRSLLRESLKLIGIALGCLVAFTVIFFVSVKTGIVIPWRWMALCYWTGFLIWCICVQFRQHLRQPKFWITFLGLLVIHVIGFIAVLQRSTEWHNTWFLAVVLVEGPCFAVALGVVVDRKPSH